MQPWPPIQAIVRNLVLIALLFVVWGCQTPPPPPEVVNATANDQKLIQLQQWQFRGRLAFKSDEENFSANVRWQQDGNNLRFVMTNVVGVTLLELQTQNGVTVINVDGDEYTGSDAAQLIKQISGWQIPLEPMQRWVKGLANTTELATRAENGLLQQIQFQQNGTRWLVNYQQFTQAQSIALPRQLTILGDKNVSIRLKVNKWTIN